MTGWRLAALWRCDAVHTWWWTLGSSGFQLAADLQYLPGEVILEVGADRDEGSTPFLAGVGPLVVSVDADPGACVRVGYLDNVQPMQGLAEEVLVGWDTPIRFAWLDGHDWPYDGPDYPPGCWDEQERQYRARGQDYSKAASQASHLRIAELVADNIVPGGIIAFDDTWRSGSGWDGKGGTAVPYLLGLGGFELWWEDALVVARRLPR
jgi:hypothetical protein